MVALGMLPKEKDFRQLKRRMETLEEHNSQHISMVSWNAKRHGGSFQIPYACHPWVKSSLAARNMEDVIRRVP